MAFGNEIRFKIGGDSSSLEKTFASLPAKAEAAGRKASAAFARTQQTADKLALSIDKERESRRYGEASTLERIKRTTTQLRDLTQERDTYTRRSVPWLQKQLEIEEKTTRLRQLQKQAQSDRVAGDSPDVGTSGGRSGITGRFLSGRIGGALSTLAYGALAAIPTAIMTYFQRGAAQAEAQADVTGAGLSGLRGTLGTIGGLGGQLKQTQKERSDLSTDIQNQQGLLKSLTEGPFAEAQNMVNPAWIALVDAQRQKLEDMTKQADALGQRETIITRELDRQNDALNTQVKTANAVWAIELRRGSALDKARAMQKIEEDKYRKMKENPSRYTPEELRQQEHVMRQAAQTTFLTQAALAARRREVVGELTSQAAVGRTFSNGASRPLSETERIARRAQRYRQLQRDSVLTGASQEAARGQRLAEGDEETVAGRLSRGSSQIVNRGAGDLTALKAEIVNSNALLKSIDSSLKPQDD